MDQELVGTLGLHMVQNDDAMTLLARNEVDVTFDKRAEVGRVRLSAVEPGVHLTNEGPNDFPQQFLA